MITLNDDISETSNEKNRKPKAPTDFKGRKTKKKNWHTQNV